MENREKGPEEKNKKRNSLKIFYFSIMVVGLIFLPTTIVLGVSLLPTFVAAAIDHHKEKTAWLTIGSMNFAGAVPGWISLLQSGHSIEAAFKLISQPQIILVSYAAAGAGWMIYSRITAMVAGIAIIRSQNRLQEIERIQKEILRKWGNTILQN